MHKSPTLKGYNLYIFKDIKNLLEEIISKCYSHMSSQSTHGSLHISYCVFFLTWGYRHFPTCFFTGYKRSHLKHERSGGRREATISPLSSPLRSLSASPPLFPSVSSYRRLLPSSNALSFPPPPPLPPPPLHSHRSPSPAPHSCCRIAGLRGSFSLSLLTISAINFIDLSRIFFSSST